MIILAGSPAGESSCLGSLVQLGGLMNQACSSDPSEQSLCRSELPSNQISDSRYKVYGRVDGGADGAVTGEVI